MPLHLRISDARECCRSSDRHTGDEGEQSIGDNGGDAEPTRKPAHHPVYESEEVAGGTAAGEELTHQNEKRDDSKNVIANGFVGGVGEEIRQHLDVAHHQVNAERCRQPERHCDVGSEENEAQQDHDEQGHLKSVEHSTTCSMCYAGGERLPPDGRADRAQGQKNIGASRQHTSDENREPHRPRRHPQGSLALISPAGPVRHKSFD